MGVESLCWKSGGSDTQNLDEDEIGDPFAIELPILMIAMKCDLVENFEEELVVFQELLGTGFPTLALSVRDPTGLQRLGHWLFDALEVVRVYTKAPGRPADTEAHLRCELVTRCWMSRDWYTVRWRSPCVLREYGVKLTSMVNR